MLYIICLIDLLKEELPHIYHLVEVAHKPISVSSSLACTLKMTIFHTWQTKILGLFIFNSFLYMNCLMFWKKISYEQGNEEKLFDL